MKPDPVTPGWEPIILPPLLHTGDDAAESAESAESLDTERTTQHHV